MLPPPSPAQVQKPLGAQLPPRPTQKARRSLLPPAGVLGSCSGFSLQSDKPERVVAWLIGRGLSPDAGAVGPWAGCWAAQGGGGHRGWEPVLSWLPQRRRACESTSWLPADRTSSL